MLGFLRLSTQPQVVSFTPSIRQAWILYRQYLADPHVVFLNEPPDFDAFMEKLTSAPRFVHESGPRRTRQFSLTNDGFFKTFPSRRSR